ncbi:MAG: hypothetical protein NVSMB51_15010 [Solirubrobacteraceae bacterium]
MASVAAGRKSIVEQRVRIAGFATRALLRDGQGPTFVLLHGFGDSADTWRAVIDQLGRRGRAAVALDLPGFGHADPLVDYESVLDQLADFAAAAVDRYGECVLVGNSLGGTAALLADVAVPRVPIAPAGFDVGGWIYRLEGFWLLQTLLRAPLPATVLRRSVGQIFRLLAVHDQGAVSGDVVGRFAAHHRDRRTILGHLSTARRLIPELSAPLAVQCGEQPVMVIWGKQDRMLPVANHELVLARLPAARVELLDRCGHCPQLECAPRVARLLTAFA